MTRHATTNARVLHCYGRVDARLLSDRSGIYRVGKTWTVQTNIYELPDTTFLAPSTLVFTVYEDTALALPAGVLQAFGIGYVWDSPMSTSLSGTVSPTQGGAEARDWYSDGTGRVQYSSGSQLFQLTGVDVPTSASNTSWGAIKGLFK